MVEFIGRTAELGVLERAYGSARSEFIPIYGRRRVGKSELVLRFMKDKPGVYYVGQQSSAALQVGEFLEEAARALGMPLLAELRADDWARALVTVVDQWTSASSDSGTKLVLALDEFQWIEASSPGLIDPLLRFWFRFVFPNMSAIRSAGAERAFAERIAPSLDAWFGECFERLCREALPFIYASEAWWPDSRLASSGTRRRRSTSSECAKTTGRISASAGGERCGRRAHWKRSSRAGWSAIRTHAARRSAAATSCAGFRRRRREPGAGTPWRTCMRWMPRSPVGFRCPAGAVGAGGGQTRQQDSRG